MLKSLLDACSSFDTTQSGTLVCDRHTGTGSQLIQSYTVKNNRISRNIWRRVFHILTEPVWYAFVSVNRRNSETRAHIAVLKYGRKTRRKMSVDIRIFYSVAQSTNAMGVTERVAICGSICVSWHLSVNGDKQL